MMKSKFSHRNEFVTDFPSTATNSELQTCMGLACLENDSGVTVQM